MKRTDLRPTFGLLLARAYGYAWWEDDGGEWVAEDEDENEVVFCSGDELGLRPLTDDELRETSRHRHRAGHGVELWHDPNKAEQIRRHRERAPLRARSKRPQAREGAPGVSTDPQLVLAGGGLVGEGQEGGLR